MVTRRVKTGGAYVGSGGLGAPSPPQWQNTYEDQEFTGAYVSDPGGGPDQWQYSGSAAYAGHNPVVFDGTSDYLSIASDPFPTTPEYFTAAFCFRPASFASQRNILHANASMVVRLQITSGYPQVILNCTTGGAQSLTTATAPETGQMNVLQIAGRCAADSADSVLTVWLNGVEIGAYAGILSGGYVNYSSWGLFAGNAGGNKFAGDASLAWVTFGATAAHYITPSTYDFNDIRDLGADGSAPGVVPQVFYGGQQTASEWNTGDNQGSGADWTMAGDGVV